MRNLLFAIAALSAAACFPKHVNAVVQVECSAPNAVIYLLTAPPPKDGAPTSYLERVDAPANFSLKKTWERPYWVYATAPGHDAASAQLVIPDARELTRVDLQLETTEAVESLQ